MMSIEASPSLSSVFSRIARRELSVALRNEGQWLNPLLFFVIVVTLFPLGIGPGPNTLSIIAPGVLWVSALLSVMLSLDTLFRTDYLDGSLEQFVLAEVPLSLIVLAKIMVHWLMSGLPLLLMSPILGVSLNLPVSAFGALILSLLLGTLTLSLLGAIGAALTVSLNHAGVLLSLLVLPLSVPVLIFGASAVSAAASGQAVLGQLALMAAFLALTLSLAPYVCAASLRIGVAGSN